MLVVLVFTQVAWYPVEPNEPKEYVIEKYIASQYANGVMQRVIWVRQNRLNQLQNINLGNYDGFVAIDNQEDIGKDIYLRPSGTDEWERFLIVDCCSYSDGSCYWMERNNIKVEVDYDTVIRWGEKLDRNLILRALDIDVKVWYN